MGQHPSYDEFLRAKAAIAPRFGGMQVDEATLNPALKPHTRRMVSWGLQGGRRAWFANFGLHKTATQLETMRVLTETTGQPTLITAPLGVRREFMREAQERFRGSFAVDLKFIRDSDQVDGPGIYLTNYESVREGKVSPDPFIGVSLDEAAILRGFGGTKTFREFMALFAGDDRRDQSNRVKTAGVPYRFVATATPSPNDYIELLSYAGFLDVMDIGQAKTRFFKRNSEKADHLTLMQHKEREFQRHGFAYLGMKTITTDVVRENNQTYRLGWSEQCKDGSRMGCGVPEYLLIFRRPPSDTSNGYADRPVKKAKKEWDPEAKDWRNELGYSRARWQIDAHGYMRSNGDRTLLPEELEGLDADQIYKVWKAYNLQQVYDFEHHVRIGEALEKKGRLPPTFMLLPPHSAHPDVWTDVARMMTINAEQARKGNEMHLCPLQFDIVDRAIAQYTEPGEWVYDPFGGLMTVPFRAVKLGRKGIGVELNKGYWLDGCKYVEAASREAGMPSLFDLLDADQPENQKLRRIA